MSSIETATPNTGHKLRTLAPEEAIATGIGTGMVREQAYASPWRKLAPVANDHEFERSLPNAADTVHGRAGVPQDVSHLLDDGVINMDDRGEPQHQSSGGSLRRGL